MAQRIEVAIEDLLLDHENPRLGSVGSQSDALRELIELSVRNFEGMMESVKLNGLDPGDLFFLVDESAETGVDGYTAVDGNRRLAALKVLREPALLVGAGLSEATVKRLRAVVEGFDPALDGDKRLCVVFPDREDADAWILRRHGRGMAGEGRIAWGPLEIQRFQGDRSILDILDFVGHNAGYEADAWADIRAKLDKKSSILRRLLESKAGREALGLSEVADDDGDVPTSDRDPSYLVEVLKRLLADIVSGTVNTRTHNKAKDIEAYFKGLPAELQPSESNSRGEQTPIRDLSTSQPDPAPAPTTTTPKATQTRVTGVRQTLSPKQVEFKQPVNAKGAQFMREATRLKLKDAPLSCAFLLRGFIQFVVDGYMHDNGLPFWDGGKQLDLHVRADRVIEHLIANKRGKRGDLSGIKRKLAEKASKNPASIQALNDYHHDQYQIPDADALRSGWDDATALFVAILGRAGK